MPAVPVHVRKDRAARLRTAGRANATQFHAQQIGRTIDLLTETDHTGHSEHFVAVRLTAPSRVAHLLRAKIIAANDDHVLAEPA